MCGKELTLKSLPHDRNVDLFKLKAFPDNNSDVIHLMLTFLKYGRQHCGKKEKMLVTSIFSFSHYFFNRLLPSGITKVLRIVIIESTLRLRERERVGGKEGRTQSERESVRERVRGEKFNKAHNVKKFIIEYKKNVEKGENASYWPL